MLYLINASDIKYSNCVYTNLFLSIKNYKKWETKNSYRSDKNSAPITFFRIDTAEFSLQWDYPCAVILYMQTIW